jgi:branched-chain amino acid transport system substrate-binding protein
MSKKKISKKIIIISGIIILAIISLFFHYSSNIENQITKTETGPIKIGGLFALTGKWQVGGETEANFARIAIDEINKKGGIAGRKIEFVLEDDKCSGKDSLSGAQKLINKDKVKFVLGPSCTPATSSAAPLLNKNKIFTMAFTTTADHLLDKYDYIFRTSPPSKQASRLMGVVVKKKGIDKVAVISETTDFAKS